MAHCVCVSVCVCELAIYNAANRSDCQFEFYERAAGSSSIVNTFNTLMKANQDTIYIPRDIHTYIVFISIYVEIGMHGHKSQSHAYEICINMSIKGKQSRPNAICLRPFRSAVMLQSNISRYQHRCINVCICVYRRRFVLQSAAFMLIPTARCSHAGGALFIFFRLGRESRRACRGKLENLTTY